MDLTESFPSDSEQLTYADIGKRTLTVTVTKVVPRGDKPKDPAVHLAEFPGKPLLPGKNVGSLLREAWGTDGKAWVGRRMTIYGDPEVFFGKEKTGGVRVSNVSHIDSPVSVPRRGKGARGQITVEPLTESTTPTAEDWAAKIAGSDSIVELRQWWQIATAANRKLIEKRVKEIETTALGDSE